MRGNTVTQFAANSSPLNTAAIHQLTNAQQLAAALYQTSIPSPGGSAFAHFQQAATTNPEEQRHSPRTNAITGLQLHSQTSSTPQNNNAFAQLKQLALLRNAAGLTTQTVENGLQGTLGIGGATISTGNYQQQIQQQTSTNNNCLAALASQLQRQAATLENATQILGSATAAGVVSPLLSPINLQQHQQQLAVALAQQQQQVYQLEHQQQQQQVQQSKNQIFLSQQLQKQQQHQSTELLSFNKDNQHVHSLKTATKMEILDNNSNGNVTPRLIRRIRRRRPKDKPSSQRQSNSIPDIAERKNNCSGNKGEDNTMALDSPDTVGPFSVQPMTPGGVTKMECGDQQQQQSEVMLTTFEGVFNTAIPTTNSGPQTPLSAMSQQDQSPPSLFMEQQQQKHCENSGSGQRESMDDSGDGNLNGRMAKLCRVCGDTATGYNFNVISCESCKAFFRRNALRPKEFKCPYSNECEITNISRRFCQKCRLRKCFTVGMKKEWILSEDQLRRRKNARIKSQMSKDQTPSRQHSQQPKTPTSAGSAIAPVTPSFTQGTGLNAFSPSQQQQLSYNNQQPTQINLQLQQQQIQFQNLSTNSQQISPISTNIASVLTETNANKSALRISPAMHSLLQHQTSPLALAAAITKLTGSPKQLSPNSAPGLDTSPLASPFGVGNSPEIADKQEIIGVEQQKVSSSGLHSPPPILPIVVNGEQQSQPQYDANIIRFAQQQLLQQAQLQQAAVVLAQQQQQRRQSADGLLLILQQQQQQHSPVLSPIAEQYNRLMMLNGQQQQQSANVLNNNDNIVASLLTAQQQRHSTAFAAANNSTITTPININNNNILPLVNGCNSNSNMVNNDMSTFASSPSSCASSTSAASVTMAQVKNFLELDSTKQHAIMQAHMQHTIKEELGNTNSAFDSSRSSPNISAKQTVPTVDTASHSNTAPSSASPIDCPDLRNYQLNSLEQRELDSVKAAFASMDADLKTELLRNGRLLGIMTMEQTQSPLDMMCLLDALMRRFVKLAKKLPTFNELSSGGKFSLLRAAMIDLLTLRGASRLDTENRCWKSPLLERNISCKIDMFDRLNDSMQKCRVMNFYNHLHDKLKTDQVANNLIVTIVLFIHYTDTELSETDRLLAKKHHDNYKELLRRYLESVYGPDEAKQIYDKVPEATEMLKNVTEKVPDLFSPQEIDKNQIKLFMEFFRLNGQKTATTTNNADANIANHKGNRYDNDNNITGCVHRKQQHLA